MAYQLKLKNVTDYRTEEITPGIPTHYIKTHNKDGSITNHSVLGNNTKSAANKTFDWVFRHIHPDDEHKRVFTIKDLKIDEVTGLNNGTFTVKLNQDQDFTVEYRSNATDTGYIDTGHLYFSISSI
ncbi:hypothetical protein [Wolbachia endosymbiont of Folsomia candida]|uniref:hypothetical protein n=1 Tax=Wolbachia endosymbiont of Folsomia candida TaxID=169402 RepID=UPI000AEC648A|nr:hypothetical protein [Wolbachia endosymbiont of Folsomia candida]APR98281.1 hypothetical protein ASM33_03175 [Wolbachia endosymbiont of Folsomia candida]